jgi:hypothetical protein
MDISAARQQLTPEEHAAGLREGRYLYCGVLGHMARECPNKRPRSLHIAATNETTSTTTTAPVVSGKAPPHI